MLQPKKNQNHKFVVASAFVAIAFFVILFTKGLTLDSKKINSPLLGHAAKDFHVQILQGAELLKVGATNAIDLADLKGFPLIINFWASWCASCAEEASVFESFWQKHSSQGIKVLGIAVHDKAEDVMPFVKSMGKTYPIALDEEGHAALNYGVTGVPETVFINAQGIVVHKEVGPMTSALLEKYLAELGTGST